MAVPDHLTCLLRNLDPGQEATVTTGHATTDCFQIGKEVCQLCILSPCLFNFYAEYLMWNAGLDEALVGIKIARRNINKLKYADAATAAAAAKSLQSCLTLCDSIDGSPLGSSVPGILQARTLEWVAISFSNAWKWKVKGKSLSRVWLLVTPWTTVHQALRLWDFPGKSTGVEYHCLLRSLTDC